MSRLPTTITLILVVTLTIVHHALSNDKCQCGIENKVARRIIGGHKVPPGKYPWLVSVKNMADNGSRCTGAIINDKFVMLASHCVDYVRSPDQMMVYHDQKYSNLYSIWKGTPLKVTNVTKLERDGRPAKKDDIALLELEKRLVFTKTFSPICLTPEIKHKNYFVAGWGVQQASTYVNGKIQAAKPSSGPRFLSEIPLTFIPDKECSQMNKDTEYRICVQGLKEGLDVKEIKTNICSGDSGGPLMTRGKDNQGRERVYTVGVASTSDCNARRKFAVYEKTIAHKKWIKDNTKDAVWCEGSSHFFASPINDRNK